MRDLSSIIPSKWLNGTFFVRSHQWTGGCALNVDTGASKLGLSMQEAAALAPRSHSLGHGITLLISRLDKSDKSAHSQNDRQISLPHDLSRLFGGIPASLVDSSGIFFGPKAHFDLVRAGAAGSSSAFSAESIAAFDTSTRHPPTEWCECCCVFPVLPQD